MLNVSSKVIENGLDINKKHHYVVGRINYPCDTLLENIIFFKCRNSSSFIRKGCRFSES